MTISQEMLIRTHPIFTHAEDISILSKPLEKLNITYFCHVTINSEGVFSVLGNNPKFIEVYLKNKYYNADLHLAKKEYLTSHILWDAFETTGQTNKMNQDGWELGLKHTFSIVQGDSNTRNFYHFSTSLDNKSINQVYLNNIDLLNRFIEYFNQQTLSSKDLRKAYDLKLSIDAPHATFDIINNIDDVDQKRTEMMNLLTTIHKVKSKFFIQNMKSKEIISIAPQQFRCFSFLLKGYSIKQIGKFMNLSPRTVEFYLKSLREQVNCMNARELIIQFSLVE